MTTFIITLVLLTAGILAGLIQYFVDFKGLPIYQPPTNTASFSSDPPPDFWRRLLQFFKRNWQLLGYLTIGIAGAFLVPMIAKLAHLQGIKTDFSCLGDPSCSTSGWDVFILLGYGIISGYSSVRLIRSVGSILIGNITKYFQEQQQSLESLKNEITELKAKLDKPAPPPVQKPAVAEFAAFAQEAAIIKGSYFDEPQNEKDKTNYYSGIDLTASSTLFTQLNKLLTETHTRQLEYNPSTYLYPLADKHPDSLLRSIYSGKTFTADTLVALDKQADFYRNNKKASFNCLDMSLTDYEDQLEKEFPYNCEHVVPQSWFNKKTPMRGDLHHLFACEVLCNSFRGNYPYYDFPGYGTDNSQLIKDECGKKEMVDSVMKERFEPELNKGTVARAVLYFLVRYPNSITGKGYSANDIPMLLNWHNNNSVTIYELHRNQVIYATQGNRNPFIDFPSLANNVDFKPAFESQFLQPEKHSKMPDDEPAATEFKAAPLATFAQCVENPNTPPWTNWRAAESLKTLLKQVNILAPSRKKDSDGMIGDAAHQTRDSDHNPWVWDAAVSKGVVTALDITNDPAGKCSCQKLADSIQANKDERIKYVIWNRQIMNSSSINGAAAWTWRPYNGTNPHNKHIHISVKCDKDAYDSIDTWNISIV